jgi:hypothetical protein
MSGERSQWLRGLRRSSLEWQSQGARKEIDDILEEEGIDPYFIPKIHSAISEVPGLKENILKFADAIGIKKSSNLKPLEKVKEHGEILWLGLAEPGRSRSHRLRSPLIRVAGGAGA